MSPSVISSCSFATTLSIKVNGEIYIGIRNSLVPKNYKQKLEVLSLCVKMVHEVWHLIAVLQILCCLMRLRRATRYMVMPISCNEIPLPTTGLSLWAVEKPPWNMKKIVTEVPWPNYYIGSWGGVTSYIGTPL